MSERPEITLRSSDGLLTFFWAEDRYQHRFKSGSSTFESTASSTCESPVYTDPHEQDGTLFLSGNAGIGHWSASVEVTKGGFVFDVALRMTQVCESLASIYIGNAKAIAIADAAVTSNGLTWISPASEVADPVCTVRYKYRIGATE